MARELLISFYGDPDDIKTGVKIDAGKGPLYVKTKDIVMLLAETLAEVSRLDREGKLSRTDDVAGV